jgi:hypothetical protein
MPSYIVKVSPDEDLYVKWSTIVDEPTAWGTREEMFEFLMDQDEKKPEYAGPEIEDRFARADQRGTSSFSGEFGWDDDEFMFQQMGMLPRQRLADFLASFDDETQRFDESLIIPFEDEDGEDS